MPDDLPSRIAAMEKAFKNMRILGTEGVEISGSMEHGFVINAAREGAGGAAGGGGGGPATGACCIGPDCHILTSDDCATMGGTYQGDGMPCSPNPCVSCPTNETIQVTFSDVVICNDCFGSRETLDISINGVFILHRTFFEGTVCLWGNFDFGGQFQQTLFSDEACIADPSVADPRDAVVIVENLGYEGIAPGGWFIHYGDDSSLYGWFSALISLGDLASPIDNQMTCTGTNTGSGYTFEIGNSGTITVEFL